MEGSGQDRSVSPAGAGPKSSGGHAETCPPYRTARALRMEAGSAPAGDPGAWPAFFDFLAAPHGQATARVDSIYLEAAEGCSEAVLRSFLAAAHARGLKVEFLYRDEDWQADHLAGAKAVCDRYIEAFNPGGPAAERFDGIHLALEDAGHWSQRAFQGLVLYLRQKIESYNSKGEHGMTLAADLDFSWRERGEDRSPQFSHAVAQCDYVVSLAYRDTAGAQVSCAVPQALAAARQRKGFCIGAETRRLIDQDFATYYEEGWEYMEQELAKLPALLAASGGALSGIALREYECYRKLRREPLVSPFPDVRVDAWAFPYILAAHQAGIIGGYLDGSFLPTRLVTRADMAVFASHVLAGAGQVPEGPAPASFPDVPTTHWVYKYVECAKANHVITGDRDGQFRPEAVVNRAELAVYIARAVVRPPGEAGLAGFSPPAQPTFPDVTADGPWSWCYKHVEYLAAQVVVSGYPDGRYHPEDPCPREQMAVYLAKALRLPVEV